MNLKTILSSLIAALLVSACASSPNGEEPAASASASDTEAGSEEEASVPEALRGIPDVPATETITINGDKFDLYIWQVGKKYDSKICVRYKETGSRMWRNTCGTGAAQRVKSDNMRGFVSGDLSRDQRLKEDAARVRKTVVGVLNGRVTITDLKGEILEALDEEEDAQVQAPGTE